ncbi:MAG: threonine--tRNA ligase, partial [Candidatus Roizmanbacteria bacterium]|nr:threonine--tRNA ligase [Candidatus Roizmanbacteria bacterium]
MENKNLEHLRHSCAHLLAAAVIDLYPQTKVTLGPAIDNGFYYDFDFGDVKISDTDLSKIEKRMQDLVKKWDDLQYR